MVPWPQVIASSVTQAPNCIFSSCLWNSNFRIVLSSEIDVGRSEHRNSEKQIEKLVDVCIEFDISSGRKSYTEMFTLKPKSTGGSWANKTRNQNENYSVSLAACYSMMTTFVLRILAVIFMLTCVVFSFQLKMWPISGKLAEGNRTSLLCSHKTGQRQHRKLAILQKKLFLFLYLLKKVGVNG